MAIDKTKYILINMQPDYNYPSPEDLVHGFKKIVATNQELVPEDYELCATIKIDNEKIQLPVDDINDIEPDEKPGMFIVNLKHEIGANKGKIILITGATLIALGSLAIRRKHTKNSE